MPFTYSLIFFPQISAEDPSVTSLEYEMDFRAESAAAMAAAAAATPRKPSGTGQLKYVK